MPKVTKEMKQGFGWKGTPKQPKPKTWNGHKPVANADYAGMEMPKWPAIEPKWCKAFEHGLRVCAGAHWVSRGERAEWHRWLAYSFGIEK